MIRSLLEDWHEVAGRVRSAGSVALFLDFDGTLAPIVPDPYAVAMNRASRAALLRLAANPRVDAWIVSGRCQADLRNLVGVAGMSYLGVHGGDTDRAFPESVMKLVADARRELESRLNGTAGVLIEDKRIAFAVHHRRASATEATQARKLLDQVIGKREGALRIVPGDRVWEVLPREIRGKGAAVRHEWRLRAPDALPIYIGNDGTDESAFAALAEGITARVGAARPTRARYALRNSCEVARFLKKLEEQMR